MAYKLRHSTNGNVEDLYKDLTTTIREAAFESLGEKQVRLRRRDENIGGW